MTYISINHADNSITLHVLDNTNMMDCYIRQIQSLAAIIQLD